MSNGNSFAFVVLQLYTDETLNKVFHVDTELQTFTLSSYIVRSELDAGSPIHIGSI